MGRIFGMHLGICHHEWDKPLTNHLARFGNHSTVHCTLPGWLIQKSPAKWKADTMCRGLQDFHAITSFVDSHRIFMLRQPSWLTFGACASAAMHLLTCRTGLEDLNAHLAGLQIQEQPLHCSLQLSIPRRSGTAPEFPAAPNHIPVAQRRCKRLPNSLALVPSFWVRVEWSWYRNVREHRTGMPPWWSATTGGSSVNMVALIKLHATCIEAIASDTMDLICLSTYLPSFVSNLD